MILRIVVRYRPGAATKKSKRQSCCFKRSRMSFDAGPLTSDSFERRVRVSDVVRNSLAIAFWLIENIFATFEPHKIMTPIRQTRKLPRSTEDGWPQLKLQSQILVRHLWRKRDPAKVAGDQLEFATRSKQQRKARSHRLVVVLFALAHLAGAKKL